MAAVVCASFLLAWLPYATVSLISALLPRDDQEAGSTLRTVAEESTAVASSSLNAPKILDIPSLLNWTVTEVYGQIYTPESKWSVVSNISSAAVTSTLSKHAEPVTRSPQLLSGLPPVVTLIPAMFAKSHSMINPLIYQLMNEEFRHDVYVMVFGQTERRHVRTGRSSLYESKQRHCFLGWLSSNRKIVRIFVLLSWVSLPSLSFKRASVSPTAGAGGRTGATPCPRRQKEKIEIWRHRRPGGAAGEQTFGQMMLLDNKYVDEGSQSPRSW